MLRGLHDTRWPLLFALVGYWGLASGSACWLAFDARLAGRRHLDRASPAGLAAVAVLMLARWILRDRLGLTRLLHA